MRIGAVVPAAGLSRRMGREKILLPFAGSTMLETVLGKLAEAGVDRVVVVIRPDLPDADRRARAAGAEVIVNPHPDEEMIVSIRLGVDRLIDDVDAFFVWPVDHPAVKVETLTALVKEASRATAAIPLFGDRRGHPAIIGADLAAGVARIPDHEGLRWLWRSRADAVREITVDDPGVLENLDDPETYRHALDRSRGSDSEKSE